MTVRAIPFVITCFISLSLYGQKPAFKVLVNSGKNEFKSKAGWQPVKVGLALSSTDELKVGDNSYLGLVHVNGKSVELRKPGPYKVSDLSNEATKVSTVIDKYTDFVISSNATRKNTLAATGAVSRGPKELWVYAPKKVSLFNNYFIVDWAEENSSPPFSINMTNMFEDEIFKQEYQQSKARVDLKGPMEQYYLLEVSGNGVRKKSEKYTITPLTEKERAQIAADLKQLGLNTQNDNALDKLRLAAFFEEKNLLMDAATAHIQAIQLNPDIKDFTEAYDKFKSRNGLMPPPDK